MATPTYNFKDCASGATFPGVSFKICVNSSPLKLAGALIRMSVFNKYSELKRIYSNAVNDGLTVTNADGIFQYDPQIVDLGPGDYTYRMDFSLADGSTRNYVRGAWRIT